jgi:hypothetical protein
MINLPISFMIQAQEQFFLLNFTLLFDQKEYDVAVPFTIQLD